MSLLLILLTPPGPPAEPPVSIADKATGVRGFIGTPFARFIAPTVEIIPIPPVIPPGPPIEIYPGVRGFLNTPFSRFIVPGVEIIPIPFVPPPVIEPNIEFNLNTLGPRGFLGIPIRRFREKSVVAFAETQARFQQIGIETWGNFDNPEVRFSQMGLEVWVLSDDQLRRLVNVYFL